MWFAGQLLRMKGVMMCGRKISRMKYLLSLVHWNSSTLSAHSMPLIVGGTKRGVGVEGVVPPSTLLDMVL